MDLDEKTRIKDMNALIRCIQIVYEIVEIGQIEEIKKQQEKDGYLGYRLPWKIDILFLLKMPSM